MGNIINEYIQAYEMREYLTEEDGQLYLILPESKTKVRVEEHHEKYIADIDVELLKAAEEIISDKIAQREEHSEFYLIEQDGHLHLTVEVITEIETEILEGDSAGCGIDHVHNWFSERITE